LKAKVLEIQQQVDQLRMEMKDWKIEWTYRNASIMHMISVSYSYTIILYHF
jgi:hypothetical protein